MVIVSDMPEALANEYRLVDNRSAEISMWDRDRLIAELRAIEGDMGPFFQADDLKSLLGDLESVSTRTVTAETIQSQQQQLDTHFESLAEDMQKRTQFVKCQHCGKEFGFDKDIKGYGFNPHQQNPAGQH